MHLLGNADTEVSIGTRCIRRIIGLCLDAAALMLDREVPYTCVGMQIVWSATLLHDLRRNGISDFALSVDHMSQNDVSHH